MNRGTIFLVILMNIFSFSHEIEFSCIYQINTWISPIGAIYTCYVAQVKVKNNPTSLESVEGVHLTGKSNSDVQALSVRFDADETRMQKLPKNIDKFFPNLQVLVWQYGNLASITADDLRPFPELKLLYLSVNKITSLDADLFQHTPKLQIIQFWSNQITNVAYDLFENLNDLTHVYFNDNPCINFMAGTPQQIQELTEKLKTHCPPLATTTESPSTPTTTTTKEYCNFRCSVNDEVDELSQTIKDLQQMVIDAFTKNEKRFLEIEKKIQEILSSDESD